MAKTRGVAKRLTASGAPKNGTVAKRKTGAAKQDAKAAKAAKALKDPRTGKQQRVVKKLRREAQQAAEAAEDARFQAMEDAMRQALDLESNEQHKDQESLNYFKKKLLPTLATSGINEEKLTELMDKFFRLDSTKQQARAMLAAAQDDTMEDAPAGEYTLNTVLHTMQWSISGIAMPDEHVAPPIYCCQRFASLTGAPRATI